MKIELTDEQFGMLLMALGIAVGAAMQDGNDHLKTAFLVLTNHVGSHSPHFRPYPIEESKGKEEPGIATREAS